MHCTVTKLTSGLPDSIAQLFHVSSKLPLNACSASLQIAKWLASEAKALRFSSQVLLWQIDILITEVARGTWQLVNLHAASVFTNCLVTTSTPLLYHSCASDPMNKEFARCCERVVMQARIWVSLSQVLVGVPRLEIFSLRSYQRGQLVYSPKQMPHLHIIVSVQGLMQGNYKLGGCWTSALLAPHCWINEQALPYSLIDACLAKLLVAWSGTISALSLKVWQAWAMSCWAGASQNCWKGLLAETDGICQVSLLSFCRLPTDLDSPSHVSADSKLTKKWLRLVSVCMHSGFNSVKFPECICYNTWLHSMHQMTCLQGSAGGELIKSSFWTWQAFLSKESKEYYG